MINFFFKRKQLVLDCFTRSYSVFNYAAPDYAHKFYPPWWKALPSDASEPGTNYPISTVKRCEGVIEQYQHGFIIPLWSDLMVTYSGINGDSSYQWKFADNESTIAIHPSNQRGGFMPDSHYLHLKLVNPWIFSCAEDVPFQFMQPIWNFDEPNKVFVPNAIINYKYQHAAHVNLLLARSEGVSILEMPLMQPMAHVLPLSERELVLRHHLVDSDKEWDKLTFPAPYRKFTRNYRTGKALVKSVEQRTCPFGFGKGGSK